MTFDINSFMVNENTIGSRNLLTTLSVEETYFLSTLKHVKESKNEINECTKRLYKSILESGNDHQIINESFSDFFEEVKKIIDKFIAFIKSLFQRFSTAMHALISSDKYLKKHKDDFKKFNSKHEFKFDGYNFTFDSNVPKIDVLRTFNADFVGLDSKSIDDIDNRYRTLIDSLQYDFYDNFRAEVLGLSGAIDSTSYHDELFAIYRDGSKDKSEISVEALDITLSLSRLEEYKKFENDTKKTRDRIEKEYEEIKKTIKNMIYRNTDNDINKLTATIKGYDGNTSVKQISRESMTKLDLFIKAKVNQVVEISAIHSLAYSYKLDAIKDCFKQDKQLLYKALGKIQKDYKLESVSLEQRYGIKECFRTISINKLNSLQGEQENNVSFNRVKDNYPEVYKENSFFVQENYNLENKEELFFSVYEQTERIREFTEEQAGCKIVTMESYKDILVKNALTCYCGSFNENATKKGSKYIAVAENYEDVVMIAIVNSENGNIAQINVPYVNVTENVMEDALLFDEYTF